MENSTIIYGPPGTGKSTAIITRMREAIDRGIDPGRIGLCSFTKAAATELAQRVGVKPGKNIATLHSYAFRLCGLIREQVVDRAKLAEFSKISKIETTGASIYDAEQLGPGDYYLAMYGYMRSILLEDTKEAFYAGSREGSLVEFQYFCKAYDQFKAAYGYMDFSDMLTKALERPAPDLDILFLDEAQDFSPAQWKLIRSWLPSIGEVVLALDDDQTLYKFTGADPDGGPEFEREYQSTRVILDKSYRVPSVIHSLATRLIKNVKTRVEKEYLPVSEGGEVKYHSTWNSVPVPEATTETLILFRNHSLRSEVEDWLQMRGLPYLTDNGARGPLQSFPMMAIQLWLRAQADFAYNGQIMLDPRQWGTLTKMAMPVYARKFREQQIESIIDKTWDQVLRMPPDLAKYFKTLQRKYGTPNPETKIRLSTIHGSKGREADRVILLNAMSQKTAEGYTKDPDPEVRAFYVGVTRARKRLDIVHGDNPLTILR